MPNVSSWPASVLTAGRELPCLLAILCYLRGGPLHIVRYKKRGELPSPAKIKSNAGFYPSFVLSVAKITIWTCLEVPTINLFFSLSWSKMLRPIFFFNSLWPSDAIWWQRCESTLAQVMACCLMAPSHYLNQCWLIISEVQVTFISRQFQKICLNHQ